MREPDTFERPAYPESHIVLDTFPLSYVPQADDDGPVQADDDIVGRATPEHSWPGIAFVWTTAAAGVYSLRSALVVAGIGDQFTLGETLAMLPMGILPGAVMLWVAWMIHNFKLAGLGVAMLMILSSSVFSLITLWHAEDVLTIGFMMVSLGLATLWIGYLWIRRGDFS